jgi:hypothetical protein
MSGGARSRAVHGGQDPHARETESRIATQWRRGGPRLGGRGLVRAGAMDVGGDGARSVVAVDGGWGAVTGGRG